MIRALRFIGTVNAGVWLGMAIFFTASVGPSFFSSEVLAIFGGKTAPYAKAYGGAIAQIILKKYWVWHQVCGVLALAHMLAEWLYQGNPLHRLRLGLATGILAGSLLSGWFIHPRLERLQVIRYHTAASPEQREAAARSFGAWHGVSQAVNLGLIIALFPFFWLTITPPPELRLYTPLVK